MTDDERQALLIVGLLLSGASASCGFLGGRMSVPEPQAEVRLVRLPPRIVRIPVAAAPLETRPAAVAEPAPVAPVEPAPVVPPAIAPIAPAAEPPKPPVKIEAKPKLPKVQPKPQPKAEREQPARKPRPPAHKAALPPCELIKREYDAMSWPERMAAYHRASPEEIALGKRCLGF